jgi:NADP-dependent 3-hydroxy acid dehydrogenase YdfG
MFLGKGIEEASLDDWHRVSAVNLTGVFLGTKLAVPSLRECGRTSPQGSAIVNLASVAGLVGSQLDPLYSAASSISIGVRFFRIGFLRLISCKASSPPLSHSSLNR